MGKAGQMKLDFTMYFEPEDGIRSPSDFTAELTRWADREGRRLWVERESMEPVVELDGVRYECRLAEPGLAAQNHKLSKFLGGVGYNHSFGRFLGYDWVYLYKL